MIPILVLGDPYYPTTEWRRALVLAMVAFVVGFTVHRLVAEVRDRVAAQHAIAQLARDASHDDARDRLCRVAAELSGADVTALLELAEGKLQPTASTDAQLSGFQLHPGLEPSGAAVALAAGRSFFVADAPRSEAIAQVLVRQTGARSVLFEPVIREGRVVGVLVLVWSTGRRRVPDRVQGRWRCWRPRPARCSSAPTCTVGS